MMAQRTAESTTGTTTLACPDFVNGYEVRPGLRMPWDSNHERLAFSFFAVMDEVEPPRWHGEVVLAGQVLHRTGSFDSHHLAGRAAERSLVERIVDLFSF